MAPQGSFSGHTTSFRARNASLRHELGLERPCGTEPDRSQLRQDTQDTEKQTWCSSELKSNEKTRRPLGAPVLPAGAKTPGLPTRRKRPGERSVSRRSRCVSPPACLGRTGARSKRVKVDELTADIDRLNAWVISLGEAGVERWRGSRSPTPGCLGVEPRRRCWLMHRLKRIRTSGGRIRPDLDVTCFRSKACTAQRSNLDPCKICRNDLRSSFCGFGGLLHAGTWSSMAQHGTWTNGPIEFFDPPHPGRFSPLLASQLEDIQNLQDELTDSAKARGRGLRSHLRGPTLEAFGGWVLKTSGVWTVSLFAFGFAPRHRPALRHRPAPVIKAESFWPFLIFYLVFGRLNYSRLNLHLTTTSEGALLRKN